MKYTDLGFLVVLFLLSGLSDADYYCYKTPLMYNQPLLYIYMCCKPNVIISSLLLSSVATPWVFSQDLGFSDPTLGSWVFFWEPWVFSRFF